MGVGLPAPLDHPARDGPLDSLHHGQVLPVVVGLQEKPVKALKVEAITTSFHHGRADGGPGRA